MLELPETAVMISLSAIIFMLHDFVLFRDFLDPVKNGTRDVKE